MMLPTKCDLCERSCEMRIGLTIKGPMVCTKCFLAHKDRVVELIIAGVHALMEENCICDGLLPRPDCPKHRSTGEIKRNSTTNMIEVWFKGTKIGEIGQGYSPDQYYVFWQQLFALYFPPVFRANETR